MTRRVTAWMMGVKITAVTLERAVLHSAAQAIRLYQLVETLMLNLAVEESAFNAIQVLRHKYLKILILIGILANTVAVLCAILQWQMGRPF